MKTRLRRCVASLLVVSVTGLGALSPAQAGMLTTEAAVTASERHRIAALLDQEEVRTQLVAHGVELAYAKARVSALTDEEAAQLAHQIDALPAGGKGAGVLLALLGAVAVVIVVIKLLPVIAIGGVAYLAMKQQRQP
ncbi:MAG TPA: PA2779 family protein [Burkholderiales bacterium]|nr:PA2779 family protein [Burkholderiales bacterium]